MENDTLIKIVDGVPRNPMWRMAEPVNLEIKRGEQVAIVGDNAAGKSRLVEILTGHYPLLQNEVQYDFSPSASPLVSDNLKYITFRDSYGEQDGTYYYQQRWNQHDIADDSPTVRESLGHHSPLPAPPLGECSIATASSFSGTEALPQRGSGEGALGEGCGRELSGNSLFSSLLEELWDERLISLSSGELRRFQIAKALATNPRVLILDNPFIGLDAKARGDFRELLRSLIEKAGLQVILVLSKQADIPDFITHVLPVEGLRLLPKVAYKPERSPLPAPPLGECLSSAERGCDNEALPQRGSGEGAVGSEKKPSFILRFRHVSISYGGRTILQPLDWTVREGERWALSGPNGSGKSTLLSLVCADNPQAYACDIELFGHRRGTGESIWEIKKHIGYVSPEMHRAYQKNIPAIDVVASGLSDSVGLYFRPKPEQRQTVLDWMHVFGVDALADRSFLQLSSGEQRLCLLARAFVKDPELLILDEPLHGLDDRNSQRVRQVIEQFCQRPRKTLVMVTHYEEELPPCITHRLDLTPSPTA